MKHIQILTNTAGNIVMIRKVIGNLLASLNLHASNFQAQSRIKLMCEEQISLSSSAQSKWPSTCNRLFNQTGSLSCSIMKRLWVVQKILQLETPITFISGTQNLVCHFVVFFLEGK